MDELFYSLIWSCFCIFCIHDAILNYIQYSIQLIQSFKGEKNQQFLFVFNRIFLLTRNHKLKWEKKEESEENEKVKEWEEKKEGNDWTYSLSSLFHFPIRLIWFIAKHPKTKEKGNKTRHVQVHMQTSVSINIRYPSSISGRSSTVDCDYLIKQTRKKLCGYLFPWPFELQ